MTMVKTKRPKPARPNSAEWVLREYQRLSALVDAGDLAARADRQRLERENPIIQQLLTEVREQSKPGKMRTSAWVYTAPGGPVNQWKRR